MESVDVKAAINEDEGCLKGVETTTADTIVASNQASNLIRSDISNVSDRSLLPLENYLKNSLAYRKRA